MQLLRIDQEGAFSGLVNGSPAVRPIDPDSGAFDGPSSSQAARCAAVADIGGYDARATQFYSMAHHTSSTSPMHDGF